MSPNPDQPANLRRSQLDQAQLQKPANLVLQHQQVRPPQILQNDANEKNRKIGDYAILADLGKGGFGVIYRVRSLSK